MKKEESVQEESKSEEKKKADIKISTVLHFDDEILLCSGQSYYTVGHSVQCDFLIPKTCRILGPILGIEVMDDSKVKIQDLSSNFDQSLSIIQRIPKE